MSCPPDNQRDAVGRPVHQVARNATTERVRQASTDRCSRVHELGPKCGADTGCRAGCRGTICALVTEPPVCAFAST